MVDMNENLERNAICFIDGDLPESDDDCQPPESPGTQKLQRLATTRLEVDDPVAPAKMMERPISSGSTGFRHYTYGAPPKRDLHIAKKQATALYGNPKLKHSSDQKGDKATTGNIVLPQAKSRSPPVHPIQERSGRAGRSQGPLCTVDSENNQRTQKTIEPELQPIEAPATKRAFTSDTSMRTAAGHWVDLAPLPRPHSETLNVAPVSKIDRERNPAPVQVVNVDTLNHEDIGDASSSQKRSAVMSGDKENITSVPEETEHDGLALKHNHSGQSDVRGTIQDGSTTQMGSPRNSGSLAGSEPAWRSPCTSLRPSAERVLPGAKSVLRPLRPMKVFKRNSPVQKRPTSTDPGNLQLSTGRSPSEEDLYYLLIHRLRQREQTEKRLAARQRQLETENSNLSEEVREYERELSSSLAYGAKKEAENKAQTAVIDDIKNSYSKIKEFMKKLHEDRESLVIKAASIDQERQILQDEHKDIHCTIVEAKDATTSSANSLSKVKTDISEFRQKTTFLETSLHDIKLRLRNEQNLLAQERRRNARYENHIAEITREQNKFSVTIQQEQQNVLNALKSIRTQLGSWETNQVVPTEPPSLPALEQCVEMLQTLTKIETAGQADVADMVQVLQGLTESINSFQKQSEESLQRTAISRAQSDSNLLSQITEQFNALADKPQNQDQIAELREAKTILEERVRCNEDMLSEVRNGKESAEKREGDLRSGNDRLGVELTKLRETVLATKKSSGPMAEFRSLVMKWTSTNSLLAESLQKIEGKEQKLQSQEEQIRSLSEQLSQARAGHQEAEEETQRLSQRLAKGVETDTGGKPHLVAERELHISNLQQELKRTEDIFRDQSKEMEEIHSVNQALAKQHDEAKLQLDQMAQNFAAAKSDIEIQNRELIQLEELREEARCVPGLVHDCAVKDGAIQDLKREIESLKASNQQVDSHQVDAEKNANEIFELKLRLQNTEEISQQLALAESGLKRHNEEIKYLKDAHRRATSLEREVSEKDDRITQLTVRLSETEEPLGQLNDLRMQLSRYQNDLESVQKKLEAAEGDAAQTSVLETELKVKEDEISKLSAKWVEAQRIAETLPEMKTQMDRFSETFIELKRELEGAHQVAEQLKSTKVANTALHKTIAELQNRVAISEQVTEPEKFRDQAMQQKDTQIIALRNELACIDVGSQRQKEIIVQCSKELIDDRSSQKTCTIAGDSHVPQEKAGYDNHHSIGEYERASVVDENIESHRKRVPANRSIIDSQVLFKRTSECTEPRLSALGEADTDGVAAPTKQHPDEIEIIPESQPCTLHHEMRNSDSKIGKEWIGNAATSSPLSDVGELFDPSDGDHSRELQQYRTHRRGETLDKNASKDDVEAVMQPPEREQSVLNDKLRDHDSPRPVCNLKRASHESQLPSSSYGEPPLLDDLERSIPLPVGPLTDTPSSRMLASSSQDVLTSPTNTRPRKQLSKDAHIPFIGEPRSMSDKKPISHIRYRQHLAKNLSPRKLRSNETFSQTDPRPPVKDFSEENMGARAVTPTVALKEKHLPNSAIKRKNETTTLPEEAKPKEKKRVKRNSSNMEISHRPESGSRSLRSSPPSKVRQTSRKPIQSSNSMSSRSTVVGRNAPAPSSRKEGSKRPRGGSKNQRYNERFGSQQS